MKIAINLKLVSLQFVGAAFLTAVLVEDVMSDKLATHWNFAGQADGFGGKLAGVWLPPIVMLSIFLLTLLIPRLDPKRKNIETFHAQWNQFVVLLTGFLLYLYWLSLYWNAGNEFNMTKPVMAGFVVLMVGVSRLIAAAQPNYTIGIRTPWTLADDTVWRRTHAVGSRAFLVVAAAALVSIFLPQLAGWFFIGSMVCAAVFITGYSYVLYSRLPKNRKGR